MSFSGGDPFFLLRAEVQEMYNAVNQKLLQFHGLPSNSGQRKSMGAAMEGDCEGILLALNEMREAIARAAENPARFNLTMSEITSRRKWLDEMGRKVEGIRDQVRTMQAAAAMPHIPTAHDRAEAHNENFIQGQAQQQAKIIQHQDDQLDEIGKMTERVGMIGVTIKDHLQEDEALLESLDAEVDTTHSRLKATQKKMMEIIKKNGSTKQLVLIGFLIIVMILLAVFAFY